MKYSFKNIIKYKYWLVLLLLSAGVVWYFFYLRRDPVSHGNQQAASLEIALSWNNLILEYDRYAEGYRSPVSARMWAYTQLAAWEAALPGLPENRSVIKDVGGPELPAWNQRHTFIMPVVLNAVYSTISQRFFYHAPTWMKDKSKNHTQEIFNKLLNRYPHDSYMESKKFGEAIANTIFNWSASDTIGHMAHMFNYDKNYQILRGEGKWVEDEFEPMPPLLPSWGAARTFIVDTGKLSVTPPLEYSKSKGSPLFAQAIEVFNVSFPESVEKRWISEFWRDDIPGTTFTGVSRWFSISDQIIVQKNSNFSIAMETWLKLALALNDLCVNIWKIKYQYSIQRPSSYIRQNIDFDWQPMHTTPPFPAYPSGHSAFGSASAVILSQVYGPKIYFIDRSHEGRDGFNSKPRTFSSFDEMAKENAFSRILIGAHFRMDCEEGLRLGQQVGEKVSLLNCRKSQEVAK
jgi:hypothetical protein